ncbi:hypothetical protein LTR53_012256 [Teratosphaeriaceae sp. CCFEE 6253]|nr:hypothetical protein LTR53_012256 [Teratosphaeriaceae sp. CCFEE 6253]
MIIRPRVQRLIISRTWKAFLAITLLWTTFEVIGIRRGLTREASKESPPFGNQRIFIASIHWTNERLLREYWVPAVAQLAEDIGREHVFVSVYESGSLDDSKGALRELDQQLYSLGIDHKVVLDETSHLDEVEREHAEEGWVQMPTARSYRQNWTDDFTLEKSSWQPRRIPYLARSRNEALQPLYEQESKGILYDRILWLNDVVFATSDVQALLATRDGEYAAACALDFKKAPAFYDTFALRDAEGQAPLTDTWPFFRSSLSRSAMIRGEAVPVASCWNGMVAFDPAPFYRIARRLSFRGIPDSLAKLHVEGSECCLIHADNPLSHTKGVWVNPNVRVAYNGTAYSAINAESAWPRTSAVATGLWRNRMLRLGRYFKATKAVGEVSERVRKWTEWGEGAAGGGEPGEYCLIDEMQFLLWNGWGHA